MHRPSRAAVSLETVEATISALTEIDETGDKRTMGRMARRLGKEQPALLRRAATLKDQHGDAIGEAAVFYSTLVWAIFDRHADRAPRLTPSNIEQAQGVLTEEWGAVEGLADKPLVERMSPGPVERQPHLCAKLAELIAEDVRTEAMTAECAELIYRTHPGDRGGVRRRHRRPPPRRARRPDRPRDREGRAERPVSVRVGQEVQEVPRRTDPVAGCPRRFSTQNVQRIDGPAVNGNAAS